MADTIATMIATSAVGYREAEQLCNDARDHVTIAQEQYVYLAELHPRLVFLHDEWKCQNSCFRTLKGGLQGLQQKIMTLATEQTKQFNQVSQGLKHVLDTLRSRRIEACLKPSPTAETDAGDSLHYTKLPGGSIHQDSREFTTEHVPLSQPISSPPPVTPQAATAADSLYDLIDDQGVHKVWDRARNKLKELQKLDQMLTNSQDQVASISLGHYELDSGLSLDQKPVTHIQEQLEKQSLEYERILADFSSIANHQDQLHLVSQNSTLLTPENLTVLQRDTEEITKVVEEIRESLTFIMATREATEIRIQQYQAFYRDLKVVLSRLHQLIPTLVQVFENLAQLKVDLINLENDTQLLVTECHNLGAWYREFARSYDHLLVEIDRRRRIQEQHQKVAEEFSSHLATLYQAESAERDHFIQTHGQYLPIDLCAPLLLPTPQYKLQVAERVVKLPMISDAALRVAQQNILNVSEQSAPPHQGSSLPL
ncbi:hypothetical protein IWQ61_009368 [Dispira simplex]|nr:hypothetical protein IWQ61_009368 [Dispira simplex]